MKTGMGAILACLFDPISITAIRPESQHSRNLVGEFQNQDAETSMVQNHPDQSGDQFVTQGNVYHVESVVASQVEKAVLDGSTGMSADAFQAIREYLEELRGSLLVEHKTDQDATDRLRDLASSCFDTITKDETDGRKSNHEECRSQQVIFYTDKATKCKAYHDGQALLPAAPCVLKHVPGGGTEEHEAGYSACLHKLQLWSVDVQNLWSAHLKCQTATNVWEKHTQECGDKQKSFESGVCSLMGVCDCHSDHTQAFMMQRSQVEEAEAARKASYSAAARIECFLSVLEGNSTLRKEGYDACRILEVDATSLSIAYDPLPSAGDSCTFSSMVCEDDWLLENYKQAKWYELAPTEACTACPTTTPTTTTGAFAEDSDLDGGGWKLVWKHSYLQVGGVNPDMRFFSEHDRPCTDLSVGWCNVPNKLSFGANQQMTMALHNDKIVYAYRGDINPELDSNWRGAILNNYVSLVDECRSHNGDPPEPEGPGGGHRYEGLTFDKANPGNYVSNCDTDRNGNGDCRWENCHPGFASTHSQMTLAIFIRNKAG